MEEDIRKQGALYLQQQRFGKKWRRVWCILYRESACSISRLEFFECKEGGAVEKSDKSLRKQQENKKVIRLADCIRVSEVDIDGCPKDTGPFLVETTEKVYVFAVDRHQLDDWTHKLCEIAFPMKWAEPGVKRGSLQKGSRGTEDEGMENNSLYSGRETVQDFRVSVRRTEASDRCRLKGGGVLRADAEALHLLDKTGDLVFTWPYRYLRRFGRDKSTFSFEAGRRCSSGEGSFEFDTKQGNVVFQAVEAAINQQRTSAPHRQASGGGQDSPETPRSLSLPPPPVNPIQSRTPPLPQPRSHFPQPPAQAVEGIYSEVIEPSTPHLHHKDTPTSQQQHPLQMTRLEPPVDKTLTGVKSLTLDTRGVPGPRKNQVKMISSCPLPHTVPEMTLGSVLNPNTASGTHVHVSPKPSLNPNQDQMYSKVSLPAGTKREKRLEPSGGGPANLCLALLRAEEPEYSLPFDNITKSALASILSPHVVHSSMEAVDPLYDSIDEMKISATFHCDGQDPTTSKVEHIYDEPEGCAAPAARQTVAAVYDDPEEMKGDAWRIMGTAADPKGHEYPYNPCTDDYAVPKRAQRAFTAASRTNNNEELDKEEADKDGGEVEQVEEEGEAACSTYMTT